QLADQCQAVTQRIAKVAQYAPGKAKSCVAHLHQREAQTQLITLPSQQNKQLLIRLQGLFGGNQPTDVIERGAMRQPVAQLVVGMQWKFGGGKGMTPLEAVIHDRVAQAER